MAKKKNNEEKMENFFDVIIRNYKTVPGIRILTKLLLPLIFCLIIILVVGLTDSSAYTNNTTPEINEKPTNNEKLSYKELLDNVYQKDMEFTINIKTDTEYYLNLKSENNILTGTVESIDGIHNLKIENGVIYEIKMNVENENNELLNNLNLDYIIPNKIINYIESKTANTKSVIDGNIQYNYEIENNNIYVITNEEKILTIKIQDGLASYTIKYK